MMPRSTDPLKLTRPGSFGADSKAHFDASTSRARVALGSAALLGFLSLAACDGQAKQSEQTAVDTLATVAPLIDKDMAQLRKGLPEGAKILTKRLPEDPASDLRETQQSIKAARENNGDLAVAKSTFFVFTNTDGVVVRSENDPDRLVDKNVFSAFPDLKKALDPKAGLIEAFGEMEEMRGVKKGVDTTWVTATAVVGKDEKVKGAFVSGWSFRAYANYLELQAKRDLLEASKKAKSDKVPIAYVFLIKGKNAYGSPDSPDVNAETLVKLDLIAKTAAGPFRGHEDITGRTFGVAAQRVKGFGDDAAVAILASVY